ncbi:hypothetical protein [Blautia marasmi]|uniref:hypothetical protein n=1 Tax=Blautia marasmi TaxID=1917868 RepID=UPI00266D4FD9|nr:hypothetical protein [Blautia marasmi]
MAKKEHDKYMVGGTDVLLILNKKPWAHNTSGCSGVSYDKSVSLWKAYIVFRQKRYYLGGYRDKNEAVKARRTAEEHVYGDFLDWYAKTYPERYKKILEKKRNEMENR